MTDPTKPSPVVVPLLPDATPTPKAPDAPKGMKIWYLVKGTTIGGLFLIGLGTMGFLTYLRSDKEHQLETVVLWVSVGFIAFGFHLVSRQSVRNFLSDFGRFLPTFKKPDDSAGGG